MQRRPKYLQKSTLPIFATSLHGESLYQSKLPENAILVMGNEANGISESIMNFASKKLMIPKYTKDSPIESLNVATSTAICLSEFRKPLLKSKI